MSAALTPPLAADGFALVYSKSYPLGTQDLSAHIKELRQLAPDAFVAFSYPPDTLLITRQSMELGFNPANSTRSSRPSWGSGRAAFTDRSGPLTI